MLIARVYCWQGDYEQALADCARALEIDDKCEDAYGVRGLIAYEQKEYEHALADFERARELGHNLFWLDEEYSEVCRLLNKTGYEEAEQ